MSFAHTTIVLIVEVLALALLITPSIACSQLYYHPYKISNYHVRSCILGKLLLVQNHLAICVATYMHVHTCGYVRIYG